MAHRSLEEHADGRRSLGAALPPHYRIAEPDWDDTAFLRLACESPEGRAVAEAVATLAELSPDPQSEMYELEDV